MTTNPPDADATDTDAYRGIVVYHRPGCPYCYVLRRGLRRANVTFDEIDIWEDPAAAAIVRSIAGGNETVPTVIVDNVARVNPSTREVMKLAREHAPDALPADTDVCRPRGWRRIVGRE